MLRRLALDPLSPGTFDLNSRMADSKSVFEDGGDALDDVIVGLPPTRNMI